MIISANTDELESNSARASRLEGAGRHPGGGLRTRVGSGPKPGQRLPRAHQLGFG